MKVIFKPIVIGAHATFIEELIKELEDLEINREEIIKTTA